MEDINKHGGEQSSYGQYDLGLKAFVRSLQVAFFAMAILIVGLLIYFFAFGGFIVVPPQKAVLVMRFGKIEEVLENNWFWRFPRPINEFVEIPLSIQSFQVRFEAQKSPVQGEEAAQGGPLVPGRDNYLITADMNIIHSGWRVEYYVSNPRKFYEHFIAATIPFEKNVDKTRTRRDDDYPGNPEMLLQNQLRGVVVKTTAGFSIDQALYSTQNYENKVGTAFKTMVAAMDVGLSINSVNLINVTPPLKTKAAFDEVSSSKQQSNKQVSDALGFKAEIENNARAERVMILAEAENYRKRVETEVKAEIVYFDMINREYLISPESVLVSLYNNVLGDVLSTVKDKYIVYKSGSGTQEVRLKINPEPKDADTNQEQK